MPTNYRFDLPPSRLTNRITPLKRSRDAGWSILASATSFPPRGAASPRVNEMRLFQPDEMSAYTLNHRQVNLLSTTTTTTANITGNAVKRKRL